MQAHKSVGMAILLNGERFEMKIIELEIDIILKDFIELFLKKNNKEIKKYI